MLEGLVAWVLNNYLGRYVENLNTDQLSIALLSGQVELENLPLKQDALRNLGLPIEIKAGFIGKVKLQIPVRQIRSAPWIIIIERLYLIANPLPVQERNAEVEELAAQEVKLSNLDAFEARWRLENETKDSGYYASSYSSWLSYGTGLITNIIENLQLIIRDVHIRYEDSVSIPDKTVAFGITIESISAQSCDETWTPGFSHWDSSKMSFKLLEMQKLAVYWVALGPTEGFSKMNVAELTEAMSTSQTAAHSKYYILSPVSAQARLKRNRSENPLRSTTTPRFVCDLSLEEVPLYLVDWQYDQIVKCTKGLDEVARLRSYRWYKPACSVKDDARAWWLYAISCLHPGEQPAFCRPHPTWEECLTKARQNVQYVDVYSKMLSTPAYALSPPEKNIKDSVEWDRSFEVLKALREIAMRKSVPTQVKTNSSNSAGRSMLVGWFPNWMGWYSSSNTDSQQTETAQLEGEILQALSDTVDNNTILKRDAVFGQFNFCLKSGTLNLCTVREGSEESSPMLELQFKNLSLNIVSKPRTSSHLLELSLGGVFLRDKINQNSLFPVLVGPPGQERSVLNRSKGLSPRMAMINGNKPDEVTDHLFYMSYEKKPTKANCDYRLCVRSKCLDVVYQPAAVKWLTEFLCLPHQKVITQSRIEEMKSRTKKELIKNWEQMLDGREIARTNWDLELDISAPQIIFVEQFSDPNSIMAVIDFGRLQLRNNLDKPEIVTTAPTANVSTENEEDEMFVTPCSTPPGSQESENDNSIAQNGMITETSIHHILYDRYSVELTELQVLIGKAKDNWRYAHNKGTSTLHILDRFNISLQIERRVVHTCDPLYPSLTLCANLPKLVAHFNESKILAARTLAHIITSTGLPSPFTSPESIAEAVNNVPNDDDDTYSIDTSVEMSRLLMLQFTVDQVALEVQSRGRSVAELQVSGVKMAFTKRPVDVSITLTVHSLLLVDALQTFGPDFELLVASHRHVGMDSMSGSLRDSEPTSPTSPGSPDPNLTRPSNTSPIALTQALTSLASSPPIQPWLQVHQKIPNVLDAEALITVEVVLVTGCEPMQIANVQFNNLDIIANQETIVELMGFIRRVFPDLKSQKPGTINLQSVIPPSLRESRECLSDEETPPKFGTTELTFDFHRLNILLLRGVNKDGIIIGKKICTATMSEAKIQATVGTNVEVQGSLGGLQVLDLTPEGHMHQRIVSVGKDPVLDATHPLYVMSQSYSDDERKAFSFKVTRSLESPAGNDMAEITIRMASLWYTHNPQFLVELQSCATEFKQYLANLARSIRSAATDMALGLVHARTEALAQSLYMNSRLSASIYGSALSFSDIASPRKRRRSSSMEPSYSGYSSARDTVLQTPYSPADDDDFIIDIKLDIVLDSPVVVLPRHSSSLQVFVAHLGKITIINSYPTLNGEEKYSDLRPRVEHYDLEIRDMNLFSLDTTSRRMPGPLFNKPETLYNCDTLAKPILHDTVVQLSIDREIMHHLVAKQESEPNLLLDGDYSKQNGNSPESNISENIQLAGSVVTALKVSLTRTQYEQLLDTLQFLMVSPTLNDKQDFSWSSARPYSTLGDIKEEDTGVTTLNMDPQVRAKLFPAVGIAKDKKVENSFNAVKVSFELPVFTIELRGDSPTGEQGLVDLSFREFIFIYEKTHKYETNVQVSLRSIFMEDLLQPEDAKQRAMVISSAGNDVPIGYSCVSRSCPDTLAHPRMKGSSHGSLPDHLEAAKVYGMEVSNTFMKRVGRGKRTCPCTPPPSPSARLRPEQNLVLVSTLIVDPAAPDFETTYNSVQRSTSIDFNCLDLVISVESWVVVIDFFSASPSKSEPQTSTNYTTQTSETMHKENAETTISVRSLTVVLAKPDLDVAKANISNVSISVKTVGQYRKEVEGKLGSMSLQDLTLHGQLYRERFVTSGKQALHFKYMRYRSNDTAENNAELKLKMSSVIYVHTKRFIAEVQAFFKHFTQLHAVMTSIHAATSGQTAHDEPLKLSIKLHAVSPMILLPVSSRSCDILVADLGRLVVTNSFKFSGDSDTISILKSSSDKKCLLDVMLIDLQNMDLYTAMRENDFKEKQSGACSFKLGSCGISKVGESLLTEKCHLKLQVERNLDNGICHSVPDMSIHGQLSTLDCTLDLIQYHLISGLLSFNLGEDTERILPSVQPPQVSAEPNIHDVWTLSSLRFDLLNVTVRLKICENRPLSCINFIRSRLTIESFSNFCQDVDLVSQEILIRDTRSEGVPESERTNIFTNILQPINYESQTDLVQAEVHNRKRGDYSKFTILLNNMRLMAIFDWWEAARDFILQDVSNVASSPVHQKEISRKQKKSSFELKLNITDSEIVIVENTSQWDTNAVILKSTTVLTYKPAKIEKPLSCSLNNCEMFSCILGMEDDTALSIIDPVTLNMDINKEGTLEIQLHLLTVRLSYHDMRMFLQMLNSLPQQMLMSKKTNIADSSKDNIFKLIALGFKAEDCITALDNCDGKLDDAALWLTQNAVPVHSNGSSSQTVDEEGDPFVKAVEVKADCISLCIIDDCADADVPLLEVSFSDVNSHQNLTTSSEIVSEESYQGALECVLASDYYNRVLSGWEPIIEPWKCLFCWKTAMKRLQLEVEAREILNINVTSTLTELYHVVKNNWLRDLSSSKESKQVMGSPEYRRRLPFVAFELKNETGSTLHFTTMISEMDKSFDTVDFDRPDERWVKVAPGETVPFSFRSRDKLRHRDTHKMKMHQLGVKIDGWQPVTPVTVDQVGVYFRHAAAEIQHRNQQEAPQARIVFEVALKGSAGKLVTVRSALLIVNKLSEAVEVKLESQLPKDSGHTTWAVSKTFKIDKGETFSVPLVHAHSQVTARPTDQEFMYTFCTPQILWNMAVHPGERLHETRTCHTHRGHSYRFCAEICRENYPVDRAAALLGVTGQWTQPAHTISLLPAVLIVNLLPLDLNFCLVGERGRIPAGSKVDVTYVDTENEFELAVCLENFPFNNSLIIPAGCSSRFTARIKMEDNVGRKLFLHAVVTPNVDARIKVTVSAQYWIINRTGLPLVFRQDGVSQEAAGQFEEHELARMLTPLLFSLADQDASPTVAARVGTHVILDGSPQWCQGFHLQKGIQVRRLRVALRDGRPDIVFVVGIEVRAGRGKYRNTTIVTIAPRFQLYNKSSYGLLFAQMCFTTNLPDNKAQRTYLKAMPESHMPFHWPRLDKDQLLCVRIEDIPDCCWSGGLNIDANCSMHVNVRDVNSRVYFLRLEVMLQGATFFVVFTDADTMPPPIRVDNFSEVTVTFAQSCCKDLVHSTARAHSSVPYAWDQPTQAPLLTVLAPGGVTNTYDMNNLGPAQGLTYENFIYIAFTGTFKNHHDFNPLDVESQELVLDVVNQNQVVLARKCPGQRSQLWRMTTTGQLQHEGSSPPSHPHQQRSDNILVLDIEGLAPHPSSYTRLMLRRPDPRRRSTQTWRFTDEGRLCCAHYNMCVQAQDGFFGLRPGGRGPAVACWQQWNAAVLGLPQPVCHQLTETGIPLEQAVTRQRLRPGSGFLSVKILTDGPTRVLSIWDMKEKHMFATPDEREWSNISLKQRPNLTNSRDSVEETTATSELELVIRLSGVGVSLVSRRTPEELLYVTFSDIVGELLLTASVKRFCISVWDVQIDNQLFDAPVPVVLYVTPLGSRSTDETQSKLPAIDISAEMQPITNENAVIIKYFIVKLKKLTVIFEERLLLKLFAFIGFTSKEEELISRDENDYETQRMLTEVSAAHARRYYFGIIQLVPDQIRLSMKTASKLPPYLKAIKRKLGLTLIKFEDAAVDLEPFVRQHPFETSQFLINSIIKHFKNELKWQAGIILGSVDFLGNPLGFMNDVSEGVAGFFLEGSVKTLVRNVTHGVFNSAAKVTESLSDGLGKVTMDDEHEEMRQRIRQVDVGHGKDHLVAGIKGFGFGLLGGATGIFKQAYEGATNEGIQGLVSGIGKGIVGAVTKPMVGLLDLTSETARAVRDSSRGSNRMVPDKKRPPRVAFGPGGLLPRFNLNQSLGQQYLYIVNDRNYNEHLVAYECLRSNAEDLRAIISDQKIRIVTCSTSNSLTTVIESNLSDFETCRTVSERDGSEVRHYIEITIHISGTSASVMYQDPIKKPKVRCDSGELAKQVRDQLHYAKRLYVEKLHTLVTSDNIANNED